MFKNVLCARDKMVRNVFKSIKCYAVIYYTLYSKFTDLTSRFLNVYCLLIGTLEHGLFDAVV